jgi:hypothetical protein
MKDRGLNDKEIEKAKKSQKKMMLNMDKVVMKNLE